MPFAAFEGDAIRLGNGVAVPMLRKIQPLLFRQCCLDIACATDKSRLSLLADIALEDRLDENFAVAINQALNFIGGGARSEYVRHRELHVLEKARAVKQSRYLH
jgi:hypothetical protein